MKAWLAVLLSLVACGVDSGETCAVPSSAELKEGEVTGPLMRAGQNCLRCHSANGVARGAVFSVGGTVYPAADSDACEGVAGVTVHITDSKGKRLALRSNEVGNFWSREPLEPPLMMAVERDGVELQMPVSAPIGGCALCHSWPNPLSAQGRIRAPGLMR